MNLLKFNFNILYSYIKSFLRCIQSKRTLKNSQNFVFQHYVKFNEIIESEKKIYLGKLLLLFVYFQKIIIIIILVFSILVNLLKEFLSTQPKIDNMSLIDFYLSNSNGTRSKISLSLLK